MKLVLKRKRSGGREGGWEERGKQSEGVRYLNTRSGQHRQSSKLPESEGRTGRGGRRTQICAFPHSQTHTLTHISATHTPTHTFGLLSHLWTVLWNSSCDFLAPTHCSPHLFARLHLHAPLAARADGHGVGLLGGCRWLCPVGPCLGEQQCGFRGAAIELLSPFQPLLLPVHPPRGAGGSRGDRRWGRGAPHPPNHRQPQRLHPWPGVPR